MTRAVLSVIVGFVAWIVVATVANLLLRYLLPGYAAVEASLAFTGAMLAGRLAVGAAASLASGFACAVVAKGRRGTVYVLAGLLLATFLPIHYKLWIAFPVWYHLAFLGSLAPLTVLGAMLRRDNSASAATDGGNVHV